MNLPEAARLLGAASAFDRRTVGDADVVAWQAVLDDIAFPDALEAVKQHYRNGEEWLMPVHVRRGAEKIAQERERAARSTGWAPGQAGVPREQAMPEVTGRIPVYEIPGPVLDLLAQVRAILPEGSREALMPRRVAWEREHAAYQRQRDAEPNPHYRPQTLADVLPVCVGEWSCRPEAACPAENHWWQGPA